MRGQSGRIGRSGTRPRVASAQNGLQSTSDSPFTLLNLPHYRLWGNSYIKYSDFIEMGNFEAIFILGFSPQVQGPSNAFHNFIAYIAL